jgi:hypothetical protein
MNARSRRGQPRRKRPGHRGGEPQPQDMWRQTPELPPIEPIVLAPDPTALLRSLGPPPLHDAAAEHYLAAAVERAAAVAAALAASAGVLAQPEDDAD